MLNLIFYHIGKARVKKLISLALAGTGLGRTPQASAQVNPASFKDRATVAR